jgi:hypothetical protein
MQGSEKKQDAKCIAHTSAVCFFPLTQQIAVFEAAC